MKDVMANPFNITKAVDFSDQEIHDYWVDIPSGEGFTAMTKPTSPMPMLILGGKGSGKTHLMRYFSYPLQRIRHGQDVIRGIQDDGYIGIYLRCGGLNAARFREKGQSKEMWSEVFAYYMELWLSQLTLDTILSAVDGTSELASGEPDVVAELAGLLDLRERVAPSTLKGLNTLLRELQKELDVAVNNSAITRALLVHISVTRGNLVFGIPRVIAANLQSLRDCQFLYLIDEFENLLEPQQKYVNTLLRERQSPCSFKIGARMYGVRTYSTYCADEENKEGSEFEVLRLDAMLRENDKKYEEFAKRLIAKRLLELDRVPSNPATLDARAGSLDKCFEKPEKSLLAASETGYVIDKYSGRERPYFEGLRHHLEQGVKADAAPGLAEAADIEDVVSLLRCEEFPLLEKANIFLFYKKWSSKRNLREAANTIAQESRGHLKGTGVSGRYKRTLHHFKADLLAQLLRETNQPQRYVGLTTFIVISSGLPRNLLILLKHIFAWATFNGERPFRDTPITIRSQQAGVQEASEWFYRDARMIGRQGQLVMDSINRLGTLYRGIRFSEKPSECSCSTFSADVSRSSEAAQEILDLAEKWSLLIDVGRQRDRNTERIDKKYQLNGMLAPHWDLAIYRRGALALNPDELNAIFDPECIKEFNGLMETRVARMTAPFFGKRSRSTKDLEEGQRPGLFSGLDDD
ncbi:MAG TPA: hypothetical protein VMZ31_02985 [Phycisphaerae bacterium]|nr:hypothetical protein [Phycisphaerae bacterium]